MYSRVASVILVLQPPDEVSDKGHGSEWFEILSLRVTDL
jgi:hypothetical protein